MIFVATLYVFSGGLSCEGERGGWLLIMQMSEDVCVKILCGNISEFIELFTRLLVYYFGDLSFDVHTFLKYLFSEWNSDVWSRGEIMNLGINIEQLFLCNQIFCMKKQFEATSCFQRNKPICYSILWLNLKQIYCINNLSTIFRTITKIIIQFIKEVLFGMKIFFPRWTFGLMH